MLELEHGFRVVDVHARLEPEASRRPREGMGEPERLEREMHQAGVVRAVAYSDYRERGYLKANNAVARMTVGRPMVAFARVDGARDPGAGAGSRLRNITASREEYHTSPEDIEQYAYDDRFVGFKLHPARDGLPDEAVLEELAAVARVDESDIKSAYRLLNRELELATPPPLPQDFLPRLANAVDANPRVERRAHQLVTAPAVGVLANGRQPAGVAAACLYRAHDESELTNLRLTQQRLADAGFSTPTTIRNIRRELLSLDEAGDLPDPDGNLDDYLG